MTRLGSFGWGFLGSLCFGFSKGFEKVGDVAFSAGDRGVALTCHLLALALLIAFIACAWMFLQTIWRKHRVFDQSAEQAENEREVSRTASIFADAPQAPDTFDPDAALARYMASRNKDTALPPPRKPAGGFGRRGI